MSFNLWSFTVWLHVITGIAWVGLLYYFNFIQVPAVADATREQANDASKPGPAAIGQYIAPRALLWFRWAAIATWLTGASALESMGIGLVNAFLLKPGAAIIGVGAWLGTIMMLNVWLLIWPNQRKILGMVDASTAEIDRAKWVAMMASRANLALSIPMLMCMVGQGHGLPF